MSNTITVRALDKQTWAGRVRFKGTTDSISPYFDRNGQGVVTGLTKEQQTKLEEELKVTSGTLAPSSTFWHEFRIVMTDRPTTIDISTARGELEYLFLKAHKRIANSVNELEKWPEAEYVIYDVEEDAKKENKKTKVVRDAYIRFNKMTSTEMSDALKLFGQRVDDMSNEWIENALNKIVQNQPKDFLLVVEDKSFKTKVLIDDLLRAKCLRKTGSHYLFGDSPIGHDLESTILYLDDLKNQSIKDSLIKKLKSLKKTQETE